MPVKTKKEFFLKLAMVLYAIAIFNFLANYFHLYYILWWFDMSMHFLGGLWVGGMVLWFYFFGLRINSKFSSVPPFLKLVFYFVAVMVVALVWELFEFALDTFVVLRTNDIIDTLSDLAMDFLGAVTALLYAVSAKLGGLKQSANE